MDPNNAQQDEREVQLEGERLERARRHVTLAQDQLMSLSDIVLTAIGSERLADAEDVAEIRLSINVENDPSGPRKCTPIYVVLLGDPDPHLAGSYQDPPGI